MLKRWIKILVVISLAISLFGCGFHLRSPQELPANLTNLYLQIDNPYSNLAALLKRMFESLDIKVSKSPKHAKYVFQVITHRFEHDNPAITTSNQAVTLTYRLIVNFQIKTAGGKVVFGPRMLVASREVILNANQLFTNNVNPLVKQQLNRLMTNLIFNQLISDQAIKAMGGRRAK